MAMLCYVKNEVCRHEVFIKNLSHVLLIAMAFSTYRNCQQNGVQWSGCIKSVALCGAQQCVAQCGALSQTTTDWPCSHDFQTEVSTKVVHFHVKCKLTIMASLKWLYQKCSPLWCTAMCSPVWCTLADHNWLTV